MKIPEEINQNSSPTDQAVEIIGYNKYQNLKNLPESTLSEFERKQIFDFEQNRLPTKEQSEASKKYIRNMLSEKPKNTFKMKAVTLWKVFKRNFFETTGKEWIINDITSKNLEPLIYYFTEDERFFKCENLSNLSEPNFDKGLLIVGTFGNGKTSVMKAFEKTFASTKGMAFKGFTANDIVTLFENCNDGQSKSDFKRKVNAGSRYFDDVKTERMASNFGKVNLFKDILETRYNNRIVNSNGVKRTNKTFITINYKEGFEGDVKAAIDELGELYGGRVYDRLFEMFNIIEFKGTSFRK